MAEELETTAGSDQAEDIVDMFYTDVEEEHQACSEREAVAFYDLYDSEHSSRNTPLLNSSQLRNSEEGNKPMEEGDKGGQKKDPTVEGTDTDQHTTSDHSPEQKSDSEGDFGKGNES
ncbi:hypothetical protein L208DRAFT_866736 [Tricholoma matsutake]|nr:hypothetical protein L208DRAFT_866736 [Tricholoma matsutake 945]